MSRINTSILRVPGTTSGQIDERAVGRFTAPAEAAGEALADIGQLGQQIALKEQQLDDQKLSAEIMNEATLASQQYAAWAAEADTPERIEELQGGLQGVYKAMGERVAGIGSDSQRASIEAQLTLSGGRSRIGLDTRKTQIKVDQTRTEVGVLLDNVAKAGISTGNTEAAREEIRRILSETEGLSYSSSETESVYRKAVNAMDYGVAREKLILGESIDFNKLEGLTTSQLSELRTREISASIRESDQGEAFFIRSLVGIAKETASGRFGDSGTPAGSLSVAIKRIQGFTSISDDQKRLAIQSLEYQHEVNVAGSTIRDLYNLKDGDQLVLEAEVLREQSLIAEEPHLQDAYAEMADRADRMSEALERKSTAEQVEAGDRIVNDLRETRLKLLGEKPMSVDQFEFFLRSSLPGNFDRRDFEGGQEQYLRIEEWIEDNASRHGDDVAKGRTLKAISESIVRSSGDARQRDANEIASSIAYEDGKFNPERVKQALAGELGKGVQAAMSLSIGSVNEGSDHTHAFKSFVDRLDTGDGGEVEETLAILGNLMKDPVVLFDHTKLPENLLSKEKSILLGQYMNQLSIHGDHKKAYDSAIEANREDTLHSTFAEARKRAGENVSDRLLGELMARSSRLGFEDVDEMGMEAFQEHIESALSRGKDPTVAISEKAAGLLGHMENAFVYYALRNDLNGVHTASETDRLYKKSVDQALSAITGTMGPSPFYRDRDPEAFKAHGVEDMRVSDWNPVHGFGVYRSGDRAKASYGPLVYSAFAKLDSEMSDPVKRQEIMAVLGKTGSKRVLWALQNYKSLQNANKGERGYLEAYGRSLYEIEDGVGAKAYFAGSDAAKNVFGGLRNVDETRNLENRLLSIMAEYMMPTAGDVLTKEENAGYNNLFSSLNSMDQTGELGSHGLITDYRQRVNIDVMGENGTFFIGDATPSPQGVILDWRFSRELNRKVGGWAAGNVMTFGKTFLEELPKDNLYQPPLLLSE